MRSLRLLLGPVLLFGSLVLGCGGGKVPVRGTITFDGEPVEHGSIALKPADGQGPGTGGEIKAGKYDLSGEAAATPGKKIVRIRAFRKTGRRIEVGSPAPPGTMVDEIKQFIPASYNENSTLTVEVRPGKVNEIPLELKSQEPPR